MSEYHYTPLVFSRGCFVELSLMAGVAGCMVLWTLAIDGWAFVVYVITLALVVVFEAKR